MATNAIVLGCGMVGATMARDLAADSSFRVTAVDVREENLERLKDHPAIQTRCVDLSDERRLRESIEPFDLVLGAMPSFLGLQTLRAIVEAGKRYADISFMAEDALTLNKLARQRGAVAVVDCGVAPGLSNMIVGFEASRLDEVTRAEIFVGGLPKARTLPFQYKAPFAPGDVVEEYTRPARLMEHGRVVIKTALSEPEPLEFSGVGTLEAFNTDGLRSLVHTMKIPNMREKTLRYPGHIDVMRAFREAGYFDKNSIDVNGVRVRPIDVTARLLFPKWTYLPGEEEFTVMRVIIEGRSGGRLVRRVHDLYDETDRATGTSSMARTTAYPCTAMARLMAADAFREAGVWAPEQVAGRASLYDAVVRDLTQRGVHLKIREEIIPS